MHRSLLTLFILLLTVLLSNAAHAQEFASRSVIGRGDVKTVAWYPDGSRVMISTVTGAWVYTADLQLVAHLPGAMLAVLSPDGRTIAGVNPDHDIRLWDASTLTPIAPYDLGYFRHVYELAWSPNGRYLAAVGETDESLTLAWDSRNNWEGVIATRNGGDHLLWSPHGHYLAVYTSGYGGLIWGLGGLNSVTSFSVSGLESVRWQDESTLLTFNVNDTMYSVTRWNATTGEQDEPFDSPSKQIVYTLNGQFEAFAGWDSVWITDVLTEGDPDRFEINNVTSEINPWGVGALAWSGTSRLLAVGGSSYTRSAPADLVIIDRVSRRIVHRLEGAQEGIQTLVWSRNNRSLLVVDKHQQIFIYEVRSGELSASSNAHTWVGESLAWNDESTRIAVADTLQNVTVWDATHHPEALFTLYDNGTQVQRIAWQVGQRYIAVQTNDDRWNQALSVQVWDVESLPPVNITDQFMRQPQIRFSHFGFSADGTLLSLISGGILWRFDLSGTTPLLTSARQLGIGGEDIMLNPYGQGIILFLDTYGGSTPYRSQTEQAAFWIGVLPFSDRITVWSPEGEVVTLFWEVWDHAYIPNVDPLLLRITPSNPYGWYPPPYQTLVGSMNPLQVGFLSPAGNYAASIDIANNGTIWNANTGEPLAWIADAGQIVWSTDEERIAVQRIDGSIWFMETHGTIIGHLPPSPAMQSPSGQLFWSPDGARLAHLHDGVVEIWTFNE